MTEQINILSPQAFKIFLSVAVAGVAGAWAIHDIVFMARLRGKDHKDPLVRDQRFGYAIGIVIGVLGVVGTLRFNGVF